MPLSPVSAVRRKIYIGLLLAASFVSIVVLVITNTTLPLNEDVQAMSQEIRAIRDENRLLELQILEETRLEIVDRHATAMGMTVPETISFFHSSKVYDAY